jgi:hypothetical protein
MAEVIGNLDNSVLDWLILIIAISCVVLLAFFIRRYTLTGMIIVGIGLLTLGALMLSAKIYEWLWPTTSVGSISGEYPDVQPPLSRRDYLNESKILLASDGRERTTAESASHEVLL